MPAPAEAELLARWRAGDDDAGREVCERHAELIGRIARAYRPRSSSVEDLVQEVFLTMFSRCERYEERDGEKVPVAMICPLRRSQVMSSARTDRSSERRMTLPRAVTVSASLL